MVAEQFGTKLGGIAKGGGGGGFEGSNQLKTGESSAPPKNGCARVGRMFHRKRAK